MEHITKSTILHRLLGYQTAGYAFLLFLITGDEVFDFPYLLFGQLATPVNWPEVVIEAAYILVLAALTLSSSWYFVRRVRFFEGLIPICSFCRKIRDGGEWISLESYVSNHSEAMLSHGLCPECRKQHYPNLPHRTG